MNNLQKNLAILYKNRAPKDFKRLVKENLIKRTKKYHKYFLKSNKPDFLIIGAQKSGTSSLHYYLNQHPRLVGTRPKEIHYFDQWINFGYSLEWYENHFNSINPKNKLFFETTPNYMFYDSSCKLIAETYPNIKLIIILRDPVPRAFSAWNMYHDKFQQNKNSYKNKNGRFPGESNFSHKHLFENRTSFPGFRECILLEQDLKKEGKNVDPFFLRMGEYANQIKSLYRYFNSDQLLILGFKDLVNNTEQTLEKVYSFLQVESFEYKKLNIEPRHSRPYKLKLKDEDRKFLEEYYAGANSELFELLGSKLNW